MAAYLREHGADKAIEELTPYLSEWRTERFPLDGGRNRGYTPFEYITWTDELIEHTLSIQVCKQVPLHTPDTQLTVSHSGQAHTPLLLPDIDWGLHMCCCQVDAPLSKVWRVWSNRMNYNEWFDLIGQVVLHTEDPDYASYFLFYKWGEPPFMNPLTLASCHLHASTNRMP